VPAFVVAQIMGGLLAMVLVAALKSE
jgi:hypothetical protein